MNTKRWITPNALAIAGVSVLLLALAGCGSGRTPEPTPTIAAPTDTPAPLPTLSEDAITAKEFVIPDFDAVHASVEGDPYQFLIYGNIPVSKPAADLPPELAVFLGRWEGYSYAPPVKKDYKFVLAITQITAREGKLFAWSGYNLQFPDAVMETRFRVVQGGEPSIELLANVPAGDKGISRFTYDRDKDMLRGSIEYPDNNFTYGPFELTRDRSFYVYKDYSEYLTSKRIYTKEYQNQDLTQYGQGYLVYLPEGYEDNPAKPWPLIFFVHGSGDRGENVYLLAKASPFMMIREKGPLPFIIVAPLLKASYDKFPLEYLDGVLAEAQTVYRVDPKRIYVTGLSLGGEATYRFAIHRPDTFAAIATLSAWIDADQLPLLDRIKNLPVWAIHGADDSIIPLSLGRLPVDALEKLGGNIRFTILEGRDHDTWTDTYSDPAFYDWFLQHTRL